MISHARVKTLTGKVRIIKIEQIIEFQDHPPTDKNNFDCKAIYTALVYDDDSDAEQTTVDPVKVGVQIAELASKYFQTTLLI